MVRSELIEQMAVEMPGLAPRDIELAVKIIQEQMIEELADGGRIEVRGFGSFSLNYRKPKIARNPRTGESVPLAGRHVVHFKPGKELREMVDYQDGESSAESE